MARSAIAGALKAIKPQDVEAYLNASLAEIAPEQASRLKQIAPGELKDME